MLARAVCPLGCIAGMAARAVNDRPYKAILFCVWHFRRVCRGRIYASRAVYPLGCIAGMAARAAYMPPLQKLRAAFCLCRRHKLHLIYYLLSFISYLQKPPRCALHSAAVFCLIISIRFPLRRWSAALRRGWCQDGRHPSPKISRCPPRWKFRPPP